MSKLKLGKMTGKEVAEWLGVKYESTYRNNPAQQLKKLEDYCIYERIRGGIIVKEIFMDEYDKNFRKNIDVKYLQSVVDHNYLVTVSGIAEENEISRHAATKSRDYLFGKLPKGMESSYPGLLGIREMVWAVKLEGVNNYRYMTEKEEELFNLLIKNVYGNLDADKIKNQELIKQYCIDNDLKVKEMDELLTVNGCNFFNEVIQKFKDQTNLLLVLATKHEMGLNLTLTEQETEYKNELLKSIEE